MRKKSYLKKAFSFILTACMTLSAFHADTYTGTVKSSEGAAQETVVSLEQGKTYSLPLIFYNGYNELEEVNIFELSNFVDNVAMFEKNNDGTYKITIQIDNYNKIDMFQVLKQGVVDSDTQAKDIPLGTFNIPESYICNPEQNRGKYPDNPVDEATIQMKENGWMNENWNDKYIQNPEIKMGELGVAYYSFVIDNLTDLIYVKCFRSYGRTGSKAAYDTAVQSGKIKLDYDNISEVKEISSNNYASVQGELSRIAVKTDRGVFNPGEAAKADKLLGAQVTTAVSGEAVSAVFTLNESDASKSVQQLTEIYDMGESSAYPTDSNYRRYAYAYSKVRSSTSGLAVYSDNILNAQSQFTLTYNSKEEVVFGKKIMLSLDGEAAYFAELRIHTEPKEELNIKDGDLTLVSDTYALNKAALFSANRIEETTDESSEYNLLYSMLAGSTKYCQLYQPSLTLNGEKTVPDKNVEIRFQIPDGWDKDKIKLYRLFGSAREGSMNEVSLYGDQSGYIIEGNSCILYTSYVNETFALVQEAAQTNIGALLDGVYKVNVTLWQMEDPTRLSMSNSAVASDSARLFVSDNGAQKQLYFDMQGITIAGQYGYANRMFQSENTQTESSAVPILDSYQELEYYSYFTNAEGSFAMDAYARTYGLYYPQTVGFTLPASADRDNGVYMKFYVPVMDELQGMVPGSGDGNRVAFLTISSAEKVAEAVVPAYDKTVLQLAVEKAEKYEAEKDNYTAESYQQLRSALAQAKELLQGNPDGSAVLKAAAMLQTAMDSLVSRASEISLASGIYAVDASLLDAEAASAASLDSKIQSARLEVKENGKIKVYLYTDGAGSADSEEWITSLSFRQGAGYSSALADRKDARGNISRFSFTLPANLPNTGVRIVTGSTETAVPAILQLDLKNAILQNADKGSLSSKITEAEKFGKENYTEDSYAALKNAIADAQKVMEDAVAFADEIKAETARLQSAIAELVMKEVPPGQSADKEELNKAIAAAEKIQNNNQYTESSWKCFQAVLAAAKRAAGDSAALQAFVDRQTALLAAAGKALVNTDKEENLYPGKYEVSVSMLNATAETASMGNASLNKIGTIIVAADGTMKLQLKFVPMTYLGMQGYLFGFAKVDMDTVQYNVYHYPVLYETIAAVILEEYDVYDIFNDKSSEYYDPNTNGGMYPKLLSIPVTLNENLFYVQVYVPVMESIGTGQGTKVARLSIDWAGMRQISGVSRDTSVLEALIEQVLGIGEDSVSEEMYAVLQAALLSAEDVLNNMNATQAQVDAQRTVLQLALETAVEVSVDKTELAAAIQEAQGYITQTSVYTADSLASLSIAIADAQKVYDNINAVQAAVDKQVSALAGAIAGLVRIGDTALDIYHLKDGVYAIHGIMVKVDKTTFSMSNEAINHAIKLTVKDGKYYITMDFRGLTISDQLGYLSKLSYYLSGYTLDQYGNPVGTTAEVTVDSYQKNADGSLVSDIYGTDYPDAVTFELIPEALKDGYVPLQVFVPVMDAISAGSGTQPVFLKLDWATIRNTTEDDPDFTNGDTANTTTGTDANKGTSILDLVSTLNKNSGLTSLNSLRSTSAVKSGAAGNSSMAGQKSTGTKTGDTAPAGLWTGLIVSSSIVMAAQVLKKKKRYTNQL